MEIRISDPLKLENFRVCLASFVTFDTKWSEIHSAARDLVRKFPDQMFSPEIRYNVPYPGNRIWVLRDQKSLSNEDSNLALENRLRFLGLQEGKYFRPNEEILQHCFRFSIQVRLEPEWSRLGSFLVRDSDFLTKNRLEIVRPELRVANSGVFLATEPKILRWYRLDLVDLEIDPDARLKFEQKVINTISYQRIGTRHLIVLPNMTKGRVHSVTRHMITSLAIKTYDDMRLYWRNVHGYEIPEQAPKFYCNVTFGEDFSSSGLFCYPETCVRTLEPFPITTPENVKQSIVEAFLQSLETRVASVCNQKLRFPNSNPMETVVDLVPARQEHSGLQKKVEKPNSSRRWPPVVGQGGDSSTIDQEIGIRTNDISDSETPFLGDSGYSTDCLPMTSPVEAARVYATPTVASRPFIPCFKAAVSAKPNGPSRVLFPPPKPVKPTFAPQTIKNLKPTNVSSSPLGSFETSNLSSPGNSTPIPKTALPHFGSGISKPKVFTPSPLPSQILPPVSAELMKPLFSMPKPIFAPRPIVGSKPKPAPAAKKDGPTKKDAASQKRKSDDSSQTSVGSSSSDVVAKRPKSVIRVDLDIPSMAATPGGLSKVNVATLYDWCKKNGVPAKSKDKKEELVNKVLAKLNVLLVANEP